MKYGMVFSLLVAFAASAAMAEGIPSQGKLSSLGLGSMNVVSDQAGEEVRGKAFFKLTATWAAQAGEKAIYNDDGTTTTLSIAPDQFVANDFNNGTLVVEDGQPLTYQPLVFALPLGIQNSADATHQQVIQVGGAITFSELSSSINTFQFALFSPILP